MNVGTLCSRRVVSLPTGATLSEVVQLMQNQHVGTVVVTRPGAAGPAVAGVISDRDIVRAQLARVADFSQLSTAETMTANPLLLAEDEEIGEALERMRGRMVRRAPVVNARGALVGVLSVDDLLAHLAREAGDLAVAVSQQGRPSPADG